ncbi:hypothetical protein N431DRAFT_225747 [Stipitochalara longipes BDJ]|nr:hypothetical protein N431DRAFT_225747 [Stipitochalara longipes BDJ]
MFPQPQTRDSDEFDLLPTRSPAWLSLCGRLWRPQDGSATALNWVSHWSAAIWRLSRCGANADLGSFGRRSIGALNFKTTTRKFTSPPFLFVLTAFASSLPCTSCLWPTGSSCSESMTAEKEYRPCAPQTIRRPQISNRHRVWHCHRTVVGRLSLNRRSQVFEQTDITGRMELRRHNISSSIYARGNVVVRDQHLRHRYSLVTLQNERWIHASLLAQTLSVKSSKTTGWPAPIKSFRGIGPSCN